MAKPRTVRGGSLLNAMWSTLAVCLFLLSGYLGYLALMESVAMATSPGKPALATLLRASLVHPDGSMQTSSTSADPWRGYSVLLELELQDTPKLAESPDRASFSRPRAVTQVRFRPWPSLRFVAERWRQHFLDSAELQVYSSGAVDGELRVREPGQSTGALVPLLCAFLGVLCIATSLRYQPDRFLGDSRLPGPHRESATGAAS
ncbi:MAG: hypothetical protein KIT83_10890 [Bryobacterales bacterium]|nr:hypothetical protein [Bryobacterales bacterium]